MKEPLIELLEHALHVPNLRVRTMDSHGVRKFLRQTGYGEFFVGLPGGDLEWDMYARTHISMPRRFRKKPANGEGLWDIAYLTEEGHLIVRRRMKEKHERAFHASDIEKLMRAYAECTGYDNHSSRRRRALRLCGRTPRQRREKPALAPQRDKERRALRQQRSGLPQDATTSHCQVWIRIISLS